LYKSVSSRCHDDVEVGGTNRRSSDQNPELLQHQNRTCTNAGRGIKKTWIVLFALVVIGVAICCVTFVRTTQRQQLLLADWFSLFSSQQVEPVHTDAPTPTPRGHWYENENFDNNHHHEEKEEHDEKEEQKNVDKDELSSIAEAAPNAFKVVVEKASPGLELTKEAKDGSIEQQQQETEKTTTEALVPKGIW